MAARDREHKIRRLRLREKTMVGLEERSFIVTGGASGIGKAAVQMLIEAGCFVTVADFDETAAQFVGSLDKSGDGRAQFIRTDVSQETSVRGMVEAAVAKYGRLHGAINSAGIGPRGKPIHELSADQWDSCLNVNLRGIFLCVKHEIAAMLDTGGGAIVAVSSASGVMGNLNSSEYCASKAGVTGLVRGVAIDYAQRGIRINSLLPGATDTPLAHRARLDNPKIVGTIPVPMGRMAQPSEIAAGAVWMLSDYASYMTGSCMTIDAGMTIA
jgi:NAD(P)-dependent dehydrogenase (short-subunit alcohol dehydrogenase family)